MSGNGQQRPVPLPIMTAMHLMPPTPTPCTPLDDDAAYLAFTAKDARFDGQVFVGITSTGIYCRPICRVRTPRRSHCRFFSSPAQAEAARFRPCLKCRPEIAPQAVEERWSVMDASRTLALQAAALIDAGVSTPQTARLAAVARRLGVSERHLRRIFSTQWGVTPLQYLQTRRLLLAKALLTDTQLPITHVASASGYGSLRRFNAAFSHSYRLSPGQLRKTAKTSPDSNGGCAQQQQQRMRLRLAYRAPYDLAALGRFLAQRAIPGIEAVAFDANGGLRLRRSLRAAALVQAQALTPAATTSLWLEVVFQPGAHEAVLDFSATWVNQTAVLLHSVRRWLDLDAAPETIALALRDLPGEAGLRLPGSLDAFELAVRAVLGQQVSVSAARTLATRLVDALGVPMTSPWPEVNRLFVEPEVLCRQAPATLTALGLTTARAKTLIALADRWPHLQGLLHAVSLGQTSMGQSLAALCELDGVGPWTAHYIAMRALSWPDAALPGDAVLRQAMQRHFGTTTARGIAQHMQRWSPWRSYAVLRLWNSASPQ